ncbi:MAG: hypothetical protein NVSMB49_06790 [Ktedonobacteraceae bacterium]
MSTQAKKGDPIGETQATLPKHEKWFRTLIENSSDAIALLSAEGKFLYASASVLKVLGYSPEELLGRNGFEYVPQENFAYVAEQFAEVVHIPGKTKTVEHQFVHKNGSVVWVESTITNLLHDPDITAIISNFRNITERKESENRQRVLNEASTLLVSSLDHQITLKEVAHLIVPSLADYCRIALLDDQQQVKEITANHIDPDKITLVQALYEQYKDRASTTHGLQRLLEMSKPELIPIVSESVLEAVRDNVELLKVVKALDLKSYMGVPLIARGKTIGAITFSSIQPHRYYSRDDMLFAQELARRIALVLDNARLYREAQEEIAERKQVEAQLRQSEERYRLIVEHSSDVITLVGKEGTFHYVSPASERVLGYSPEELMNVNAFDLVHSEDLTLTQAEMKKAVEGQLAQAAYRYRHKDGHWIILETAGTALFDENGQPHMLVFTSHNVTERIEAEQRKDAFINMASHELKTPITSLKGFTNILQRHFIKQRDDQSLVYLEKIDRQVNKLTKLVNDLLDVSKIQTGKLTYQEESINLTALIQEIIENVQGTTPTHALHFEGARDVQVICDKDRLGQVLINLLTNAIKYSPHAEKVIVCVSKDSENASVSVQDFGIGIAKTHQEKIFEQFYQVTDPEEKTYPGLGIGLYISTEIVKRHGGRLWVESCKGEGSTFHFTLPLVKKAS